MSEARPRKDIAPQRSSDFEDRDSEFDRSVDEIARGKIEGDYEWHRRPLLSRFAARATSGTYGGKG